MFQKLGPNSQIFILRKGDKMSLDTGFVTNVSIPRLKYPQQQQFNKPQEYVVDLAAKINGETVTLVGIRANADIDESFSNGESILIATNREALNSEILALKQKSVDIISSVDYNKNLITEYDKVLKDLNPEFAERENQKNRVEKLEEQTTLISQNVDTLSKAVMSLIEKLDKKEIKI